MTAFLSDWCGLDPTASTTVKSLYEAWVHWCGEYGHRSGAAHVFGRNLHAAVPGLRTIRGGRGSM
jgi:hypothetical protein